MWRWPSGKKADFPTRLGKKCAEKHLWCETKALRPRLIFTYDSDAMRYYQGLLPPDLKFDEPQPAITTRSGKIDTIRWVQLFEGWGWPCALLLAGRPQDRRTETKTWLGRKAEDLLAGIPL
jgi:hypothetical protein